MSAPTPERALIDPDEPTRSGVRRLLVPGVAATVVAVGTAGVVLGAHRGSGMEAVPAAVPQDISLREMGGVSRSERGLRPEASQTPSASAMASATPTASPAPASPRPSATSKPTATRKATTSTASTAKCGTLTGWLAPNGMKVYQASCANFPYVTSYGGARPGDPGEHGTGHAVDIMVSGSRGWDIANYMRANASKLGVTEVIYQQKIWTTQRSSEGWRPMADRGSATANHMDHVHVTVS
ncbi:hypothetical protein [Raineyella sp. LH-20]|uniref:hypothetical protein n=1 Tax=Raineyella sp. LH-20 TaxID=3081204 RepID=UPI0029559BB0|nr:hypothetical protein [Raineyella sp. LH-20]WOP19861.1 hypothetical protein R0146_06200 [Raineyella sp. LH-20]